MTSAWCGMEKSLSRAIYGSDLPTAASRGVAPAEAVLMGGGGAAGLNSTFIARRLGCKALIIPEAGAALSAAGALMSDLTAEYAVSLFTHTAAFDAPRVNAALADL